MPRFARARAIARLPQRTWTGFPCAHQIAQGMPALQRPCLRDLDHPTNRVGHCEHLRVYVRLKAHPPYHSPAATAAASGSPPGSAAATCAAEPGRRAGSFSRHLRIARSTAGSISVIRPDGLGGAESACARSQSPAAAALTAGLPVYAARPGRGPFANYWADLFCFREVQDPCGMKMAVRQWFRNACHLPPPLCLVRNTEHFGGRQFCL